MKLPPLIPFCPHNLFCCFSPYSFSSQLRLVVGWCGFSLPCEGLLSSPSLQGDFTGGVGDHLTCTQSSSAVCWLMPCTAVPRKGLPRVADQKEQLPSRNRNTKTTQPNATNTQGSTAGTLARRDPTAQHSHALPCLSAAFAPRMGPRAPWASPQLFAKAPGT